MSGGWSAPELVTRHAAEAPEAAAIVDGSAPITWAELDRRIDVVVAGVRAAGVPAGGVVAFTGATTVETVARILGLLRAGSVAALVPAGLTASEVAAAHELLQPVLMLDAGAGNRDGRVLDAPAIVVLTSGTTALPKGVVLGEPALAASADAWLAALPPATGWLLALGLAHVAGLGVLWRAIATRVPVRVVAPSEPPALLDALGEPSVSHASLVPTQLARLLDEAGGRAAPANLRAVLLGGGLVPPALVARALEAGWPVFPTYGLSEAGSGVTALSPAEARDAPSSAGRPLPGLTVTIEDPDAGGVGEIVVTTSARFTGYLGEPPADGPIRTGDLGRLDDAGRLTVVDRRSDRIVRGGENVSPAEVETVLLAQPGVADAALVARRDEVFGQVPVAAVVLRNGAPRPGDDALLQACRASLAGFKVPAAILRLDALPRTAGGKLRREVVRALVDGAPAGILARPDGDELGWRVTGDGPRPVLLLPGTLSNAAQLDRLAQELAGSAGALVHAIDRRGMGTSRLADPRPLDVDLHVRDVVAYLDARAVGRATVVGVSYGAIVALELAARHPDRVEDVVAWEPPYGPAGDGDVRAWFDRVARDTAAAHARGGRDDAAEVFLRAVAGDARWDGLPERARAFLAREGDAALTDAQLAGLDLDGLARIEAPTTILTGSASRPFYAPIADALAARIPGARRRMLDGLDHPAPVTDPTPIAAAVLAAIDGADVPDPVALETRP